MSRMLPYMIWIALCWPQLVESFGLSGGRLPSWPSFLFRLGLLAGLHKITARHTSLYHLATATHVAWLLLTVAGHTHLRSRSELLLECAILVGILVTLRGMRALLVSLLWWLLPAVSVHGSALQNTM